MTKRILIFGDSFSAQWDVDSGYDSWVDIITKKYNTTNIAQAGVGEYKILKQLQGISLVDYDFLIGNHTSHSRVHSEKSLHSSNLHKNCDLIYSDSLDISEARWFFENIYDDSYYRFIYDIIRNKVSTLIKFKPNFIFDPFYDNYGDSISVKGKWKFSEKNKNHFSKKYNRILANKIISCIND